MKTINDIAIEWGDGFGIVRKDQLKQSAIEWIKKLEKVDSWSKNTGKLGLSKLEIYNEPNESCESDAMIRWIKYFFNIKEEEIK